MTPQQQPNKQCIICNKIYYKRPKDTWKKWESRKYCSHKCYQPQQRNRILSEETKQKISIAGKGRKLSQTTRGKQSKSKKGSIIPEEVRKKISDTLIGKYASGELTASNKGKGKTSLAVRIRAATKYKCWRETIFKRDNWSCQLCDIKNEKGLGRTVRLNVDHYPLTFSRLMARGVLEANFCNEDPYDYIMKYPPMWNLKNGRTLCKECHMDTDTMGRPARDIKHREFMNLDCEFNLANIKEAMASALDNKYFLGQVEHSGNLWRKSGIIDMAVEETLDLFTYQFTIQMHTNAAIFALKIALEAFNKGAKLHGMEMCKAAYNILKFGNPEGILEEEK